MTAEIIIPLLLLAPFAVFFLVWRQRCRRAERLDRSIGPIAGTDEEVDQTINSFLAMTQDEDLQ